MIVQTSKINITTGLAALAYAHEIEDFNDLVDPHHLYDCCLGPKPSKYVLEKIRLEEKSKLVYPSSPFFFFFFNWELLLSLSLPPFLLAEMATRYSKDNYTRIKNLKNKPLANLTSDSKKRK